MSTRSPSLGMLVFAACPSGLGLGLLPLPERLLPLFGFAPPRDFRVRLLGGALVILALYWRLLLIGIFESTCGLWTHLALRAEERVLRVAAPVRS